MSGTLMTAGMTEIKYVSNQKKNEIIASPYAKTL
jgi:hypothetical protein